MVLAPDVVREQFPAKQIAVTEETGWALFDTNFPWIAPLPNSRSLRSRSRSGTSFVASANGGGPHDKVFKQ
jgi:hypothetical protein